MARRPQDRDASAATTAARREGVPDDPIDDVPQDRIDDGIDDAFDYAVLTPELPSALIRPPDAPEHHELLRKNALKARLFGKVSDAIRIGPFRVLEQVGAGGMGTVYAAYDEHLDRRVAIKVLHSDIESFEREARLLREAKAMARLSHPNVVTVYEMGTWEGHPFVAMEFVAGQTLRAWQRSRPASPTDWREVLAVYRAAGWGLAAAHEAGIVHRDFKPDNVLIGDDGRVRVGDFGLARRDRRAPPDARGDTLAVPRTPAHPQTMTRTGAVVGTPAYMAPEQIAGERADARADQFGFCVALYEALCGVVPFEADTLADRRRRIRAGDIEPPRRDRGAPDVVLDVVRRGLATHAEQRWPSMDALLDALDGAARPTRRWLWWLAATVVVAGLGVAAASLAIRDDSPPVAREHTGQLRDRALLAAARELVDADPAAAVAALREVAQPETLPGWRETAVNVLARPISYTALGGDGGSLVVSAISADGRMVGTHSRDGKARVWSAEAPDAPLLTDEGDHVWLVAGGEHAVVRGSERTRVWSRGEDGGYALQVEVPVRLRYASEVDGQVLGLFVDDAIRAWNPDRPAEMTVLHQLDGGAEGSRLFLDRAFARVAVVSPDGPVRIESLAGDQPPVVLADADAGATSALSPDGQSFAAGYEDGRVKLWYRGGAPVVRSERERAVDQLAFSPDGQYVVSGANDGTTWIWRADGQGEPTVLSGHASRVYTARFGPRGRVFTGSYDDTARIWDLESGDVIVLRGHHEDVNSVLASADGGVVATGSNDGTVRLWHLRSPGVTPLPGYPGNVWAASLDPEASRLAVAGSGGNARIWDLDGTSPTVDLRGHTGKVVWEVGFSQDGSRVATGSNDGTARVWNADGTGESIVLPGHEHWASAIAFSPDGEHLVTGSKGGVIRRWNLRSAEPEILGAHLPRFRGHDVRILAVEYSPDGRYVASGAADGSVSLWPAAPTIREAERTEAEAPGGPGNSIDRTVREAERTEAEAPGGPGNAGNAGNAIEGRLLGHTDWVHDVGFHPDGHALVTVSRDHTVRVWTVPQGAPLAELDGHEHWVLRVAFSPDGRWFATSSFDGTARVWWFLADEPRLATVLSGHTDQVEAIAVDTAGRRVVTGAHDGTARVWTLDASLAVVGDPLVLAGHQTPLRFVGFGAADRSVITVAWDGSARVWQLDDDADVATLMRRLRQASSICLTATQRMRYLGEAEPQARERVSACRAARRE